MIGKSVPRKEGWEKITGRRKFVDDLYFQNQLYGITVRSPVPSGLLSRIVYLPNINWDEFVIVTAADIPGRNVVAFIQDDQPLLVSNTINHCEEAILLLAHPNRYILEQAKNSIAFDIIPSTAVLSLDDALGSLTNRLADQGSFKKILINKGNVDQAWDDGHRIVEGEYRTGAQEQMYIETNGMIAEWTKPGKITVWGSMQCPFYVHRALVEILGCKNEMARVIQTETGGGFGGKEDYPSMLAGHAALLARKSKSTVRMIYDRTEDLRATTKRHPSLTRHKTTVDKNGRFVAMEIEFYIDGGAYSTVSPVVLSRGAIHAAGAYHCPNVRITANALATNTPPSGAFRGFGAPQSIFALERHVEKIARTIGATSTDIRMNNFIKPGEKTATSQIIKDPIDLRLMLTEVKNKTNFEAKRLEFAQDNSTAVIKRGIGLAAFFHGAGFTGNGEKKLGSVVGMEASSDGSIRILASSTEMGQGTNTILCQIAADALKIDSTNINIAQPDTECVPDSGPTVASRTCMIVGKIIQIAAEKVLAVLRTDGLLDDEYTPAEFKSACQQFLAKKGSLRVTSQYEHPPDIEWDEENYFGDAYQTFAWAIYVAEISIDTRTYQTTVTKFSAFQEIGRVMNPTLAEGQIEGGVVQGVGFALSEKVIWEQGVMKNSQMTNYIIPTSMDVPIIEVIFYENPFPGGPGGAKGIGELPLDGTAPAIINAVENATGLVITSIPMMPEDLLMAMKSEKEATNA
jgi:CO/xanthine dehydrogenase Mo-binding subunit